MDDLPEEILIKIFAFLQPLDLIQLTIVCKYFNDVISTSQKLVSKFSLYFRKSNTEWIGKRRYLNLIIENYSQLGYKSILEELGSGIKSLTIKRWNWSLSIDELVEIFKICHNLSRVKFDKIQLNFLADFKSSLKFDNLELEVIESDARIFNLFENSSVRRLVYDYVPSGGRFSIPELIEFLSHQQNLEDLTLAGFVAFLDVGLGKVIFHDSALSNTIFRLKRLVLKSSPLYETIHFNNFLKIHADTLIELEIDGIFFWDFSNFLIECKNLKILKIGKRDRLSLAQPLQSVQQLTIDGNVDQSFLVNFPNLKFLSCSKLKVTRNVFDEVLGCEKLEELIVERSWLGGFFVLPALRRIHLKDIRVLSGEIFRVNWRVEEICFENCWGLSGDVIEKIDEFCENLRIFVVK